MKLLRRKSSAPLTVLAIPEPVPDPAPELGPAEPAHIHNPHGGTRYHYDDPDQPDARPVCNASGAVWAEGDGELGECGLCPHIWAQRQKAAA